METPPERLTRQGPSPASPSHPAVEGDGSLGAGLPFLAAPELEHASFKGHILSKQPNQTT